MPTGHAVGHCVGESISQNHVLDRGHVYASSSSRFMTLKSNRIRITQTIVIVARTGCRERKQNGQVYPSFLATEQYSASPEKWSYHCHGSGTHSNPFEEGPTWANLLRHAHMSVVLSKTAFTHSRKDSEPKAALLRRGRSKMNPKAVAHS